MLTEEDVQKLLEVLATKEDIQKIELRITRLEEAVESLTVSVDKLVKAVGDLKTEYAAVSNQLSRHEKWIQQLAEKMGLKLEY